MSNLRDYHLNVPVCEPGFLNFIELARRCKSCGGAGYTDSESFHEGVPCEDCNGIGAVPTEAGMAVLRFVRRFTASPQAVTP